MRMLASTSSSWSQRRHPGRAPRPSTIAAIASIPSEAETRSGVSPERWIAPSSYNPMTWLTTTHLGRDLGEASLGLRHRGLDLGGLVVGGGAVMTGQVGFVDSRALPYRGRSFRRPVTIEAKWGQRAFVPPAPTRPPNRSDQRVGPTECVRVERRSRPVRPSVPTCSGGHPGWPAPHGHDPTTTSRRAGPVQRHGRPTLAQE